MIYISQVDYSKFNFTKKRRISAVWLMEEIACIKKRSLVIRKLHGILFSIPVFVNGIMKQKRLAEASPLFTHCEAGNPAISAKPYLNLFVLPIKE